MVGTPPFSYWRHFEWALLKYVHWITLLMNRMLVYSQVTNSDKTNFINNLKKVKWRLTPRSLALFIRKQDIAFFTLISGFAAFWCYAAIFSCENSILSQWHILCTSLNFSVSLLQLLEFFLISSVGWSYLIKFCICYCFSIT